MTDLSTLRAFAFDLDGTLADSIPDLTAAANHMRVQLGMEPLDADRIRSHVGDGIASLVHRALTDNHDGQAPEELWEAGYRLFIQHYREHLSAQTTLYPGVKTGLQLLRTLQLPLAVITNKSERLAIPLLQKLGISDEFSLILGGDSLSEKKPSGLPLIHACEIFNIKPQELGMVGDSTNDVLAARSAGSCAIVVSYGYQEPATLEADLMIDDITHLYDMLSKKS